MNETHRDPRVRRTTRSLQDCGHTARVFEMRLGGKSKSEIVDGIEIERVEVAHNYDLERVQQISKVSPDTARIIGRCDPRVMELDVRRINALDNIIWQIDRRVEYICNNRQWDLHLGLIQSINRIRSILLVNLDLFRAAQSFKPDVVYANDLDTLVAAHMLHRVNGAKIVYDAHEVYPEQLPTHMRGHIWHRFYTALEKELIPFSQCRFTVCGAIADYFRTEYHADGFVTIHNVPSIRHLPNVATLERRNHVPRVLYHGAYFAYRGLDEMVEAARYVPNALFVLRGIGEYESVLRAHVERVGLADKVHFEQPVKVTELVETAAFCDIGLNPFVNVCKNTEFALPNKFFEYMMAGLAVMSSDLVEMRALTEKLKVGRLFPKLDPHEIAHALNVLIAEPDKLAEYRVNAYEAARRTYHWEMEERKFVEAFDRAMQA
ncbi:glycosyltransferase [Methylobacterium sp. J-070]|uniref:glycosyltransferase n=1 Tax=Methylobacterium sp. J-070 TaxID=2836650 RepID=UPI001FBA053B|nr:glycosyltransferase [Methylobacterium sp. J-070]MCJ2054932.1 glycosyltransferase [Methylobacterium sp. J-070]